MKTLRHLSIALFAVLVGLSALDAGAVNVSLPCGSSGLNFLLQADKISASMGATDASSWEVDQLQMPSSSCSGAGTMPNPVNAVLLFNTTQPNVTLTVQVKFTVFPATSATPGSWNNTYFMASVTSTQWEKAVSTVNWYLPYSQLMAVDWLNSADGAKGKRCSHGEVVLNGQNKLGLDSFHLFPGTNGKPLNEDNYNLCTADMTSTLGGLAWWAWVLIILGVLIVLGGLGFGGYSLYQRQHHS